jgi:hypothetical protein
MKSYDCCIVCHLKFISHNKLSVLMSNGTLSRAAPEIVEEYFKWFCSFPESISPGFHSDGNKIIEANKSTLKRDEYIFLPPGLAEPCNRKIGTVERGKKIFIPSLSFIGSEFESHSPDISQLYRFADVDHDSIDYGHIDIDGERLPERTLESRFRVRTDPFDVEFPDGALFDLHKGISKAVADGVYIVWEPFVGDHEIHFEGKIKLAGRKDTIEFANRGEPAKEDHVENVTYTFKVSV